MDRFLENFVLALALSTVEGWCRIWSDKSARLNWDERNFTAANEAYSILSQFDADALRNG